MKKGEINKLYKLLHPTTIAVVGASEDESKIGNIIVRNIDRSGFEGKLLLVNPHLPKVNSHDVYPSYDKLPVAPDIAIICTPAATVPELLIQIAVKGTRFAVVLAAGFKEVGDGGKIIEDRIKDIIVKYNINVLGPNCLGFVNTNAKLNATFGIISNDPGNVRVISQSGAIATSMFDWASGNSVSYSEFITIGNKVDLNENDFLDYWLKSTPKPPIKKSKLSNYYPIGLYLESISNGEKLVSLLKKTTTDNPVIILKPGRTKTSSTAMLSHTGSIAGDDEIFDSAMNSCGVIRARGIEDFFDYLKIFSWENAPEGPNVAIVSNAGGPAVISSDFVVESGLELSQLSKKTQQLLKKNLPRESSLLNPVDVLGDANSDRYISALECVLADKNVDSVLVILTPQISTEIENTASAIAELSLKYKKPVVCSFMGGLQTETGIKILNDNKIPSFRYPERAVKALGKMWKWNKFRKATEVKNVKSNVFISKSSAGRIDNYLSRIHVERNILSPFEVCEVLNESGISIPKYSLVTSLADADEFAHRFEFPVVMKVSSPKIVHKTESGGVVVGIRNKDSLSISHKKLVKILNKTSSRHELSSAVMIQKQVESGFEILISIKEDPQFGKFILVAAGGILAELMAEKIMILLPESEKVIYQKISESKLGKILNGYRSGQQYNMNKLIELISLLEKTMDCSKHIKEIELNPVIINRHGTSAVDGRIFLYD